jgi:hypothetical protein
LLFLFLLLRHAASSDRGLRREWFGIFNKIIKRFG